MSPHPWFPLSWDLRTPSSPVRGFFFASSSRTKANSETRSAGANVALAVSTAVILRT
jgi:hypothetical protein